MKIGDFHDLIRESFCPGNFPAFCTMKTFPKDKILYNIPILHFSKKVIYYNCQGERGRKCRPDERGSVRTRGRMDFYQLIPTT